jgi:hypothetical protein
MADLQALDNDIMPDEDKREKYQYVRSHPSVELGEGRFRENRAAAGEALRERRRQMLEAHLPGRDLGRRPRHASADARLRWTPDFSLPPCVLSGWAACTRRRQLMQRRCNSKGRGSVYDSAAGICCHFCRQKKLCGEDDCERCSTRDTSLPCVGKSECARCHSGLGRFCRACLLIRYGKGVCASPHTVTHIFTHLPPPPHRLNRFHAIHHLCIVRQVVKLPAVVKSSPSVTTTFSKAA